MSHLANIKAIDELADRGAEVGVYYEDYTDALKFENAIIDAEKEALAGSERIYDDNQSYYNEVF